MVSVAGHFMRKDVRLVESTWCAAPPSLWAVVRSVASYLARLVVALIKLKLGEIQFNAEIRGVTVGVVSLSHTLLPPLVCVCVSHAGVATCIADDAIWCPNAAPTAKYAPVVVFTPSSKRAWTRDRGRGSERCCVSTRCPGSQFRFWSVSLYPRCPVARIGAATLSTKHIL